MLEERRSPYRPDEVKTLFPCLTPVECLMVANIEERFPQWHCWPDVDYPTTHI